MFSRKYPAFAITPQLHRHDPVWELGSLLDSAAAPSRLHTKLQPPVPAHLAISCVCHGVATPASEVMLHMGSSYKTGQQYI